MCDVTTYTEEAQIWSDITIIDLMLMYVHHGYSLGSLYGEELCMRTNDSLLSRSESSEAVLDPNVSLKLYFNCTIPPYPKPQYLYIHGFYPALHSVG